MAFFDKIGDKAKGLVDSAKITYKVSEEKSKLSELYEHLGLLVWEAHQNDAEPPAELVPVFDRIREIHASIEKLTAELSSVKSKINTNTNGSSDSNGECCCGSDDSSTEFAEDSFDNRSGDAANAAAKIFMPLTAQLSARAAVGRLTSFPLSARAAAISFPPTTTQNPIVRQSVIALHAVPS